MPATPITSAGSPTTNCQLKKLTSPRGRIDDVRHGRNDDVRHNRIDDVQPAQTEICRDTGTMSRQITKVDLDGLQSHEWKRVERLEAAWELAKRGLGSSGSAADSGLVGVVTEPTRRSRTPLTAKQIDAIQTTHTDGESGTSIARRFEVSRMTVWEKTRTKSN